MFPVSGDSIDLRSLPFVDRVNECRLICHPDICSLRDDKPCCVVVSKQPGAGKTSLGKECLKVALDNPPEGPTKEEWQAKLPVCTLYCQASQEESLADVLKRAANYAAARLDELKADLSEIDRGDRCEVVRQDYGVQDTEEPLSEGMVQEHVDALISRKSFLCISDETKKRLGSIARDLVLRLEKESLSKWRKIIRGVVEDPFDALEIAKLLAMRATAIDLAHICAKWNRAYNRTPPLAALLVVVDEAQWVLPGEDEGVGVLDVRDRIKGWLEIIQPVFAKARFLWTGVNSAAVDLQMSGGDQGTSIRVISVALPPLDAEQWEEALDIRSSEEAESLMEQMTWELCQLDQIKVAWKDIMDSPEEIKDRALTEMMSCTGGWPREVWHFLGGPNTKERQWMIRVFGSAERKQRMQDATVELLDLAYMHPEWSVFNLLNAVKHSRAAEEGRAFYELLHISGLQLVKDDGETPAIYVPDSRQRILGVTTIGNLTKARLRHTHGSLLLLARLRSPTAAIYAQRGAWAAFTHDAAEEATVNILSHLDAFCGRQLKQIFPWLRSALGDKCLECGNLRAFRGLVVRRKLSTSNPGFAPVGLENHGDETSQVTPDEFRQWLEERYANGYEGFIPFLYVFGPKSTSGDILLVLKDLHIHIQIKNSKKTSATEWGSERDKMNAVASEKVANIFVLVNYYDRENQRPMPFVKMSTRPYAAIRGVCREAGTTDVDNSEGFSENCLFVDLEGVWAERHQRHISALGMRRRKASGVSAAVAESRESQVLEKRPEKRLRTASRP